MNFYEYRGQMHTIKELSDLSGKNYTTICERLKRGYSVEEAISDEPRMPESVTEFIRASHPPDWDSLTSDELYEIYVNWCKRNDYKPESKVHFIRSVKRIIPRFRTVPTRLKPNGIVEYKRVIRVD